MVEQVELSSLDLRYESYRLKNPGSEKVLLASILQYGLREPLQGVDTVDFRILLDGFKRYRCAKKLSISIVPYCCLSDDEALGIIKLLRLSTSKGLNILEQARLIDELISVEEGKELHRNSAAESKKLLIIPGAGHNDIMVFDTNLYFGTIEKFIIKYD